MTIKARKAAAVMLTELEAETDAIRESIKDELKFSNETILTLTEGREAALRALDAEIEKRRTGLRKTYAELIRNEERRIALCKERLERLDGPDAVREPEEMVTVIVEPIDPMIGHNSNGAEDDAATPKAA